MSEDSVRHQFIHRSGPYAKARFGRVIPAMILPTNDDDSINFEGAADMAKYLVENGAEGLAVNGTTGESPTVTDEDLVKLLEAVRSAVEVPILAGVGAMTAAKATTTTEAVNRSGCADGLLIVSPPYYKPSQAGIKNYFEAIIEATELEVVIYDIKGRTGREVELRTILELAEAHDQVVAVKDANGDLAKTKAMIKDTPDRFQVYCGDDSRNYEVVKAGGVGAISVHAHWTGNLMLAMYEAYDKHDTKTAHHLNEALADSARYESMSMDASNYGIDAPNPAPTRAMLRYLNSIGRLSFDVGVGREPMRLTEHSDLEDSIRPIAATVWQELTEQASKLNVES